jgi:hypothetical protein
MRMGGMEFQHIWVPRSPNYGMGSGGVALEVLGRTASGGYFIVHSEDQPKQVPLGQVETWFRENLMDPPGWLREEVQDEEEVFIATGWNPEKEKLAVVQAHQEATTKIRELTDLKSENEMLRLEINFLKLLGRKW